MKFAIDGAPPATEEIEEERTRISVQIRRIKRLDNLISMLVILAATAAACLAVYFTTYSIRYAAITATIFPVVGVVLSLTGVISAAGFRSAARQLIELDHQLIALNRISESNLADVRKLAARYLVVDDYWTKTTEMGRDLVNGELAMFWGYDASTLGEQDKGKEYLTKAAGSVGV